LGGTVAQYGRRRNEAENAPRAWLRNRAGAGNENSAAAVRKVSKKRNLALVVELIIGGKGSDGSQVARRDLKPLTGPRDQIESVSALNPDGEIVGLIYSRATKPAHKSHLS
jgi:hypothetical protein